jgi:glutathione S-transferase
MKERYRLFGSAASPYAIKLRALLRYRRIPFDWVIMTKALRQQTEHLRPNLIPVLQYPDGSFRGETTTLAYDLEARHPERSVIPDDKAVAFVCDLLEDIADEWAVKPLFFYRWWNPGDQTYVSGWAGEEWSTSDAEAGSAEEIEQFRRRQISRMTILGATAENELLLEVSYHRILAAFEPHVGMTRYLFGSRPSLADFAWFGQLSEMATDPTPMRIMREKSAVYRSLDPAAGRCLRCRRGMVSARTGIERNGRSAAQDCRRTLSAVPGRQCRSICKGCRAAGDQCPGAALCAVPVQISGQMPSIAPRKSCRAGRRTSNGAAARSGASGMLGASFGLRVMTWS